MSAKVVEDHLTKLSPFGQHVSGSVTALLTLAGVLTHVGWSLVTGSVWKTVPKTLKNMVFNLRIVCSFLD